MRAYREKRKAHTVRDNAPLLHYLLCYPFMACNPRAWFANGRWTQHELQVVHDAGFESVALALGYRPPYEGDRHVHLCGLQTCVSAASV